MQFFHQATGEPLPPPPAHIAGVDEEMEQAREHDLPQWDHWFSNMMQNEPNVPSGRIPSGRNVTNGGDIHSGNVPSGSITNKGKAVLHAYEGSSSHAGEMVALNEPLGDNGQGNHHGNMGGESGVRDFGLPQEQVGVERQGVLVPYGVTRGSSGSYGWGPHHGNVEAIGFGHGMIFPHGEA